MSEREIAIFTTSKQALEEAVYCANNETKYYSIINYGVNFGVIPHAKVLPEDIIYETIVPKELMR
tara:strand:- start:23122 stop:23316 length:195 start_codon:yes stop_codon:yes gene_type:complete